MKQLLTDAYIKFSKIKVVHSIPGRVRLQIPGLKQVPKEYRHLEKDLLDLVTLLPGVTDLTLCFVTGRALLHYDGKLIGEQALVAWFNQVWDTMATELSGHNDLGDEADIIAHARNQLRRHIEAFNHEPSQ